MKMTMNIDEETLEAVMEITGINKKTAAVEAALKEFARRAKLRAFAKSGLGLAKGELKNAYDVASLGDNAWLLDEETAKVAEDGPIDPKKNG